MSETLALNIEQTHSQLFFRSKFIVLVLKAKTQS